jgi:hypothetical protein
MFLNNKYMFLDFLLMNIYLFPVVEWKEVKSQLVIRCTNSARPGRIDLHTCKLRATTISSLV